MLARWLGCRAPRRGGRWAERTYASRGPCTTHTTHWIDRCALSRCAFRALFVPSDRNRQPRWGCYLGGSGSGEAEEALGWLEGIRQNIRSRLERSTSPEPRGPWTHHLHPGGRCGGGGGHGWGGSGSTCGGFVQVLCTQSEDVIPFDILDHRLWPPDPRAARELG